MQLELCQLNHRYRGLRIHDPGRHSRLLESLTAHGQQVPVVVVADEEAAERYVLIDGYGRVAALAQLCRDEVEAQVWQMAEGRALALGHRLDNARERSALEEGWLLRTLVREHGMRLGELAVLLGRSRSWVSRRLGLVNGLPACAQDAVRKGRMSAQAAQRYVLPLARANTAQCETLVSRLGDERVSVRQMRTLYTGWRGADTQTRERIVESPLLYLAAHEATSDDAVISDELVRDLEIITSVARRARRCVTEGALMGASAARTTRLRRRWRAAERELHELGVSLEIYDAELGDANGDPEAARARSRDPRDRAGGGRVAQRGQASPA